MSESRRIDLVEALDAAKISALQLRVFLLCAFVALLDGFDTQSIAFVAPILIDEWGVDRSAFAPVFVAGLVGLMLGQFLFSPIADRYGRRVVILISTLIFGSFCLLTTQADSLVSLLVLRLLTGIGLGAAIPNVMAMTSEFSPTRIRALLVTVVFAGFPLGAVVGGLISTRLIPAFGWESVFYLGGVLPLILFLILYFKLPESPRFLVSTRRCPELACSTMRAIRPDLAADTEFYVIERKLTSAPFTSLFTHGYAASTLLLWLGFFSSLLVIYFLMSWLPLLMTESGVPIERAILASVILNLGGAFGGILCGGFIDRYRPVLVLVVAYLFAAMCLVGISMVDATNPLTMLLVLGAGVGTIGAQTGLSAFTTGFYPTAMRSTGIGIALGVGRIGSVIGPVVGGIMLAANNSVSEMFVVIAIPSCVTAIAVALAGHFSRLRADPIAVLDTQQPLADGRSKA